MNLLLESMKALSVTIGILAVGMLVIYLVRSINSREYVALGPHDPNGPWTTRQKFHAAGVHLGWFVFISAGVQGILDWIQLSTSSENALFLGVVLAFTSLPVLWSFQSASHDKRELYATRDALSWILDELRLGAHCISIQGVAADTRKISLIEEIEAELSNARVYGTERYKKELILSAARALQRFYDDLEKQIGRQLAKEYAEREQRQLEENRRKDTQARRDDQNLSKKLRLGKLIECVEAVTPCLPAIRKVDELPIHQEGIIDSVIVTSRFIDIRQLLIDIRNGPSPQNITNLVEQLQGISLSRNSEVLLQFRRKAWDSYCDPIALVGDQRLHPSEVLHVEHSIDGLINAFILSAVLPVYWSWRCGEFKNIDFQLILQPKELHHWLSESVAGYTSRNPAIPEIFPPTGLRVRRNEENEFEVHCLAYRMDQGVHDVWIKILDERCSVKHEKEIYIWSLGVLYS